MRGLVQFRSSSSVARWPAGLFGYLHARSLRSAEGSPTTRSSAGTQFTLSTECPACHGKRLKPEAPFIKFAGMDVADISRVPLRRLTELMRPYCENAGAGHEAHPEKAVVVQGIAQDLVGRLGVLLDLGLGYLTLERRTPTLPPGELQRLLARSGPIFSVLFTYSTNRPPGFIQQIPSVLSIGWRDPLQRPSERFRQGR